MQIIGLIYLVNYFIFDDVLHLKADTRNFFRLI
jgi:hypothetical protein